ncbi:uncharacterized protein [Oscarella lobularis]|uniref:uncharacterized protein n=1 Tax=Oscarella lobularis TaxID=121494 RepID=UPI003313BCF4
MIEAEAKRLEAAALNLDSFLRCFHLSHLKEDLRRRNVHNIRQFIRLDARNVVNYCDQISSLRAQTAYKEREKHRVSLTSELDLDDVRDEESQEGFLLFKCCAVMSSRDIPPDVVADAAFQTNPLDKEFKISKAIKILNERSLIQQISSPDNDMVVTFSMHHLIQASMLQRMAGNAKDFVSVLKSVAKAFFERLPHFDDLSNLLISPVVLSLTPHIYSTAVKMLRLGILDEGVYPGLVDCACQLALEYRHYEEATHLCFLRVNAFEAKLTRFCVEETRRRRQDYYYDIAFSRYLLNNLNEVDVNIWRSLSGTPTNSDKFSQKVLLNISDKNLL